MTTSVRLHGRSQRPLQLADVPGRLPGQLKRFLKGSNTALLISPSKLMRLCKMATIYGEKKFLLQEYLEAVAKFNWKDPSPIGFNRFPFNAIDMHGLAFNKFKVSNSPNAAPYTKTYLAETALLSKLKDGDRIEVLIHGELKKLVFRGLVDTNRDIQEELHGGITVTVTSKDQSLRVEVLDDDGEGPDSDEFAVSLRFGLHIIDHDLGPKS